DVEPDPHTRAAERVAGLAANGVTLWLNPDGGLGYRAPDDTDFVELAGYLREHEAELLGGLRASPRRSLDGLIGPRRTPWGTGAYRAPDGPPMEMFGPLPPVGNETAGRPEETC